MQFLERLAPEWQIAATMAEKTQPEDLLTGGLLVLLQGEASNLELAGEPCDPHAQSGPLMHPELHMVIKGRFCDISLGSAQNRPDCAVEVLALVGPAISGQDSRQPKMPLV